jgi:hypothetical protein
VPLAAGSQPAGGDCQPSGAAPAKAGLLNYRLHTSDAAKLTCLVSQAGVHHIHFVDGCDGGYPLAARELKQ